MRLTVKELLDFLRELDAQYLDAPVVIGCDFGAEHWAGTITTRDDAIVIR